MPLDSERKKAMETIRHKLALLPDQPGCYLMKNKEGKIIYVGKAKVLKNRVRSYFTGSHSAKTQRLVMDIYDFEYIVTASNMEALLLECNLIKQHSPKYNVLLKDDKSFPYIKITNEPHPRLEVTRRVDRDKAKYFGPYPNAFAAQQTKKLLDRLYPLRKCRTLPDKVCLYYHIGQCVAPCEIEVPAAEYERMISEISRFLNGGHEEIRAELQGKMTAAAEDLNFERAKEYRDMIMAIDDMMFKQTITTVGAVNRDVFGYAVDKGWMCVQIMYVRQGKLIERKATVFPYYGEEYEDFISYVTQYYSENPALPKEILLPGEPDAADAADVTNAADAAGTVDTADAAAQDAVALDLAAPIADGGGAGDEHEGSGSSVKSMLESWLKVKVIIPKRGDKKKMTAMACDNARVALEEKFRLIERDQERTVKAVEGLAQWLGSESIHRIEAFDNSNIQGTNPVSAMVVFIDGKPERKEYRKYKIKTVEGPDDYATMREVIRRRYERVLRENLPLPDLIVVDGGKGQISSATDILENELGLFVPVCGLVKDAKHKTAQLMVGDPPEVVPIRRDSQEFYLLQRIQEEVHRFAITFHREQRSKSSLTSVLDAVPGIGEKRKKALLKHFGSIKKMREATVDDFRPLGIGEKLARSLLEALRGPEDGEAAAPSPTQAPSEAEAHEDELI